MIRHWIDLRNGDLLVGVEGYDQRMEEAPAYPDEIQPLADVLLSKEFDIDESSITPYPRIYGHTEEECRAQGAWVLNVVRQSEPESSITIPYLERAHWLGLIAHYHTIFDHTGGSIRTLRETLNAPKFSPYETYSQWTPDQFIENAWLLARKLGRIPKLNDFRGWTKQGKGPSEHHVQDFFPGGIRALSEMLGNPNVDNWEEQDYVDWGVRVMEANEGLAPTAIITNIIARRKKGPGRNKINYNFPGGFNAFKTQTVQAYQQRLMDYEDRVNDNSRELDELATLLAENGVELPKKPLGLLARYQVLQECLKPITPSEAAKLAYETRGRSLTRIIQQRNDSLPAGRIELIAVGLGWYDEIWPLYPDDKKKLRISKEELLRAKREATNRLRRSRLKSKQRALASDDSKSSAA